MKVYEITIKPLTGFGTPLKGDTIFGHFCWQLAYDENLLGEPIDGLLSDYHGNPFAVFSSAYPKFCVRNEYHYILKKPELPPEVLFDLPEDKKLKIERRKEYKAKRWMVFEEGRIFSTFKEMKFLSDKEVIEKASANLSLETGKLIKRNKVRNFVATFSQPHNTINRLTGTTGEGRFAPFSVEQEVFFPDIELALFVGIDETRINIDQIRLGLERMGDTGYGKDASSGLGRFELGEVSEINLSKWGNPSPNACYTLAPSVPEKDTFKKALFSPFTRFGRHGDVLAKSRNPFKAPIIMADEGGIFIPESNAVFGKPYLGRAISNISKTEPKSVAQGYALYIPVKVEV